MSGRYSSLVCATTLGILLAGCTGAMPQPAAPMSPEQPPSADAVPSAPEPSAARLPAQASSPAPVLLEAEFKAVEDEALDLRRNGALRIHLHAQPAPDRNAP